MSGVKFDEEYKLDFKDVEIEEITLYTPKNTGNLQVVWYDFYIPLFSVLVDGQRSIVDHQFVHKFDENLPHKLYIQSSRIYDTVYLLKFITLQDCVAAGFAENECI